jgi:hypothetical protein
MGVHYIDQRVLTSCQSFRAAHNFHPHRLVSRAGVSRTWFSDRQSHSLNGPSVAHRRLHERLPLPQSFRRTARGCGCRFRCMDVRGMARNSRFPRRSDYLWCDSTGEHGDWSGYRFPSRCSPFGVPATFQKLANNPVWKETDSSATRFSGTIQEGTLGLGSRQALKRS